MKKLAIKAAMAGLVILALGWFAYAHADQSVDLRFGLFTLRGVSLAVVIYGALVIGMLAMVVVSLRNDLRTGQMLRRYDKIASEVLSEMDTEEEGPVEAVDSEA